MLRDSNSDHGLNWVIEGQTVVEDYTDWWYEKRNLTDADSPVTYLGPCFYFRTRSSFDVWRSQVRCDLLPLDTANALTFTVSHA